MLKVEELAGARLGAVLARQARHFGQGFPVAALHVFLRSHGVLDVRGEKTQPLLQPQRPGEGGGGTGVGAPEPGVAAEDLVR